MAPGSSAVSSPAYAMLHDEAEQTRRGDAGNTGEMCMNIYVGNLSYDVTEADLQAAFEAFGAVASVSIIKDQYSGQPRGVRLRRDARGV
jgi:RNA recognition motif-containing protein